MRYFVSVVLFSLAVAQAALAVPVNTPPGAPAPAGGLTAGQYVSGKPIDAKNIADPNVHLVKPGPNPKKDVNKKPRPAVVVEGPNQQGIVKAAVISNNFPPGTPSHPIKGIDGKSPMTGSVSLKRPMEFDQKDLKATPHKMSSSSLRTLQNSVAAGRIIKPLPKRRAGSAPPAPAPRPQSPKPRTPSPPPATRQGTRGRSPSPPPGGSSGRSSSKPPPAKKRRLSKREFLRRYYELV